MVDGEEDSRSVPDEFGHVPVLLHRADDLLGPAITADNPRGDGAVMIDATLGLEAFVAGDSGTPVDLTLSGPRAGTWYRAIVIRPDDLVWTGCGDDANLRINTSLRTKGNAGARVTIDSLVLYRFATKAC